MFPEKIHKIETNKTRLDALKDIAAICRCVTKAKGLSIRNEWEKLIMTKGFLKVKKPFIFSHAFLMERPFALVTSRGQTRPNSEERMTDSDSS